MSIGTRIRELRTNLKMTQEELAHKIGVTKGSIANYESDTSVPKTEVMFRIFPALNCDANYLYQDDVKPPSATSKIYSIAEQKHMDKYRALDKRGKTVVDTVLDVEFKNVTEQKKEPKIIQYTKEVPLYDVPASAGTGQFLDVSSYTMVPLKESEPQETSFMVRVSGDSMEPTYFDGDILYIKQQPSVITGEVGLFMVDGNVYVKELANDGLVSHNKSYKKILVTAEMTSRCYGKVLGARKE